MLASVAAVSAGPSAARLAPAGWRAAALRSAASRSAWRLQQLVGALLGAVARVVGARVPAHGAQPVEHRAADPVVGERAERHARASVEALGRLDQPLRPVADQVVELDRRAQRLLHLARDRLHQRQVLLDQASFLPRRRHGANRPRVALRRQVRVSMSSSPVWTWVHFASLSADDVRAILRAFGAPAYRAPPRRSPVGTINTNVAVETEDGPRFLRINEGKSEDDVAREAAIVAHAAARGVPTPAPVRRARRPAVRALVAARPRASRARSCRCSPGCRAARWRAPRSRPRTRAGRARRWRACTWPASGFADRRPGRYEPDEIDRRLAQW